MCVLTPADDRHRIDHRGYVPEIWAGLLLTALFLIQGERAVTSINDTLELAVNWILVAGTALCLVGSAVGTKVLLPRARLSTAYGFQMLGLPLIIIALAWYTWAATDSQNLVVAALGGGLGLCIEIASLRMFVDLVSTTRGLP
jgi:hypothetical protein